MNITATLEKLKTMKLSGFETAYRIIYETGTNASFTNDEIIGHLIDAEYDERYNKKLARLLKNAGFRQQVTFNQIDFTAQRTLDKNLMLRLQTCDWIKKSQDILMVAQPELENHLLHVPWAFRRVWLNLKSFLHPPGRCWKNFSWLKPMVHTLQRSIKYPKWICLLWMTSD